MLTLAVSGREEANPKRAVFATTGDAEKDVANHEGGCSRPIDDRHRPVLGDRVERSSSPGCCKTVVGFALSRTSPRRSERASWSCAVSLSVMEQRLDVVRQSWRGVPYGLERCGASQARTATARLKPATTSDQ
jgi:hypothetical protein